MLSVDHLMLGVPDLQAPESWGQLDHGLASMDGIVFEDQPGWGNRGVPLGDIWVELIGIVDQHALRGDPRAQMFSAVVADGCRLLGWALAPDDLDRVADRLELPVTAQSATNLHTGKHYTWRQVGFEETRMEPYLPFFVGWDHPMHDEARGWTNAMDNPHVAASDVRMTLSGDPERLALWLGEIEAPYSISQGPPSLTAHLIADGRSITVP